MRLERNTPVAGLDPAVARELAKACAGDWTTTRYAAHRTKMTVADAAPRLTALADAGFLERRDSSWRPEDREPGEDDEWNTTIDGNALAMASFLKPIPRKRADALLAGVLERAAAYNADESKPYVVTELLVFGSYLRADVTELGDLDLGMSFGERRPGSTDTDALLGHASKSGRSFPHFLTRLMWAQTELKQILRNRSGYINVHTEDVSKVTDSTQVVFTRDRGAIPVAAAPAPSPSDGESGRG